MKSGEWQIALKEPLLDTFERAMQGGMEPREPYPDDDLIDFIAGHLAAMVIREQKLEADEENVAGFAEVFYALLAANYDLRRLRQSWMRFTRNRYSKITR